MIEIELSVMENKPNTEQEMRRLLDLFEAEYHIRVKLRVLKWAEAWQEFVKYGVYQHGPDVSEIGSTWVGSMVGMKALRPYQMRDIAETYMFLPSVWQAGLLHGDKTLWAIPWLADTRILYYRRDLLEKAGVDPQNAFESVAAMERTLSQLPKNTGVTPWMVPIQFVAVNLHNVAM